MRKIRNKFRAEYLKEVLPHGDECECADCN